MSFWLSLAVALIKGAAAIFGYLRDKRLMDAGAAAEAIKSLEAANAAVEKANAARERVRGDLEQHPDRVRDHDKFERKD